MPTHNRHLISTALRMSIVVALSCTFLAETGFGQKSRTKKKAKVPIKVEVKTELVAKSPIREDPETTIFIEPCKGEQPGNVLGISEEAETRERVAAFTSKLRESNPKTRACAAKQLGYLGPDAKDAVPDLIQLIYDEKNDNVWIHLEDALWAIGPGRTAGDLNESKFNRSELLELIKSPNVYSRFYAVFALSYYKPISDQKAIVQALISATNDQDGIVRWMAVKGLGRLAPIAREAVPVLIQILRTGDQPMQVQSTIALGKIGPDAAEAVPALLEHLYGDDDQLYIYASITLASIGPIILPLMKDEIKRQPFRVLNVLSELGAVGAPLVIEAMRMPNKEVRKKAIDIIKWFGVAAEPAVPLLIKALKDSDEDIRREAASALETLGPIAKTAVPALISALNNSLIPCQAAQALGAIGPAAKPAVPKLVRLMKTRTKPDRDRPQICAAKVLMKMSAETKALVPASMIKRVEEWDALVMSTIPPLRAPDPTKPKPKTKDKPPPRSY